MISYIQRKSRKYLIIRQVNSIIRDNSLSIFLTITTTLFLLVVFTHWRNNDRDTPAYKNMKSDSIEMCETFLKQTPIQSIAEKFKTRSTSKDLYRQWNGIKSCKNFKELIQQPIKVDREEKAYPIAFSISVYEDVGRIARLLRLIYRPHNLYCIHVDKKSPEWFYQNVVELSQCFGNNVQVVSRARSIPVVWGHYSVLENFLICADILLNNKNVKWKYLININGKELPLRTNWELVTALKALNMSNVVQFSAKNGPKHRIPKKKPSFPVTWIKGSFHSVLRRDMVNYILHDKHSLELLSLLKEEEHLLKVPDEMFFSTLVYNPQLGAPGACLKIHQSNTKNSRSAFVARYKLWWPNYCASKRLVRGICIFGVQHLHDFTQRPEFFANKFNLGFYDFAYDCLEYWILKKWENEQVTGELNRQFNKTFYSRLFCSRSHI
uniref:Protein xylosyltransferase n=1 Tax=Trichobilharzia regenti TaxID=157069 RepID=A0AA85K1S4_TRIRE|nr:unnamed protein product [Trichobilharzia regenti]